MTDRAKTDQILRDSEARIDYLEEVNRFTLDALEQALTMLDFQPGINRILRPPDIVRETRKRLEQLIDFEAVSFLLVNETSSQFEFTETNPEKLSPFMQSEVDRLIETGTFAWAVREIHPVIVPSADGEKSLMLHAVAGSNRVRGMFVGLLESEDFYDVSLSLVSILLLNCANALQSVELYDTLNDINRQLAANVKRSNQARTELRDAYDKLRRAEETYRSIFENALEGIFKCTPDGRLLEANPTLAGILGFESPEKLMEKGDRFFDLLFSEPQRIEAFQKRMESEGAVRSLPAETQRPSGERVWLSMNCRAVAYTQDAPVHFEGMVKDVTLQRTAEAQAEERRRQLVQADKLAALGTLVAGVAHEINNPNGVVMLNVPILAGTWKDAQTVLEEHYRKNGDFKLGGLPFSQMREEIPLLFSEVSDAADRIKNIVRDLKNYSRRGSDDQRELVDLNTVVKTAVRLVHHQIKRATHRFSVEYDSNTPPVMGNFQKLEQVVINLIINACQSLESPDRALKVRTSEDPDSERVLLTIMDEGTGMDKQTLDRIMDPFFTTKRDSGGTGLGLSVSAGIVNEHGGELTFTSEVGAGTTAVLSLPAAVD